MKYIGNGAFLPGVPDRDLTPDEVKQYGKQRLLDSGLYQEPPKPKPKQAAEVSDD